MSDKLKLVSANCAICGRQVWVGVEFLRPWADWARQAILHLDHLGGALEQDETGALRPSKLHQYQIHICKAVEK